MKELTLKGYPVEFATIFQTSFNCLSKINMKFNFRNEGFVKKYWRFLYTIPCVVILHAILMINVVMYTSQGEIVEIAHMLPPFLLYTQALLKFVLLFLKRNQVTSIIKELGELWRTVGLSEAQLSARGILMKRIRFSVGVIHGIIIFATPQFFMTPLLETLVRRFVLKQEYKMVLPLQCRYPFGPIDNWLLYGGFYVLQSYSAVLYIFTQFGAVMMLITLCALLGNEFILLGEDILYLKPKSKKKNEQTNNEINNEMNSEEALSIKEIVKRHQKLCILANKLDEIFNQMVFLDLLFVGITTCFFGYAAQFVRGKIYMINNYMAVASNLMIVFVFCYYGEFLTEAGLDFGDMAYNNLWYKGDKSYRAMILFIIMRAQRPCNLTSLKYAPVNLNMFTKVINTTWSYFSLMNSVYGGE